MDNQNINNVNNENENGNEVALVTNDTILANVEAWQVACKRLTDTLSELSQKTFIEVFGSKVAKGAPFSYQMLANINLTSAGYVRDKWVKFENETIKEGGKPDIITFILDQLDPTSAERRAAEKAKAEAKAQLTKSTLDAINGAIENWIEAANSFGIEPSLATIEKAKAGLEKTNGENAFAVIAGLVARIEPTDEHEKAFNDALTARVDAVCATLD